MKNIFIGFLLCFLLFISFSYTQLNIENEELIKRIEKLEQDQKTYKEHFDALYENLFGFGANPNYISFQDDYNETIKEIQTTLDKIQKNDKNRN